MKGPFSGIFNPKAIRELEEDQQEMIRGVVEIGHTLQSPDLVPAEVLSIPLSENRPQRKIFHASKT